MITQNEEDDRMPPRTNPREEYRRVIALIDLNRARERKPELALRESSAHTDLVAACTDLVDASGVAGTFAASNAVADASRIHAEVLVDLLRTTRRRRKSAPAGDDTVTAHNLQTTPGYALILSEVNDEVIRSTAKHGDQRHRPLGGGSVTAAQRDAVIAEVDAGMLDGSVTWKSIIDEEYAEAFSETDPARIRAELVQLAAVVLKAIDAIDHPVTPTEHTEETQ